MTRSVLDDFCDGPQRLKNQKDHRPAAAAGAQLCFRINRIRLPDDTSVTVLSSTYRVLLVPRLYNIGSIVGLFYIISSAHCCSSTSSRSFAMYETKNANITRHNIIHNNIVLIKLRLKHCT